MQGRLHRRMAIVGVLMCFPLPAQARAQGGQFDLEKTRTVLTGLIPDGEKDPAGICGGGDGRRWKVEYGDGRRR